MLLLAAAPPQKSRGKDPVGRFGPLAALQTSRPALTLAGGSRRAPGLQFPRSQQRMPSPAAPIMSLSLPFLPVTEVLPDLTAALVRHNAAVLEAPPGAGKTTLVPLALRDQPWLAGRKILMLEPRRLATRAAAARMAHLLGEPVGQTVGYRMRLDSEVSPATRIEVMTEGTLLRQLQRDPELAEVGAILFDEFHERNLDSDLALAFSRDLQAVLREDLRLLIMSATLDGRGIADKLDGAPLISAQGRSYPVAIHYRPTPKNLPLGRAVGRALQDALHDASRQDAPRDAPRDIPRDIPRDSRQDGAPDRPGDVLVFLPGEREIRQVCGDLSALARTENLALRPLYGSLRTEGQQAALDPDPQGRRKVILATAIAETSLTIEGVRAVIDSGLSREPRFDPGSGMSRLITTKVSQAGATQRAGRAGRQGPGSCYRLWPEPQQRGLAAFAQPEILAADLTAFALDLALWGAREDELLFIDPPPAAALSQARALLQRLEALDGDLRVTGLGRRMAELPLHPRLAHMLLKGQALKLGAEAAAIAALLMERDPLIARAANLALRLELLDPGRQRRGAEAGPDQVNGAALARIRKTTGELRRRLKISNQRLDVGACGQLLALAYPDRVAQRRGPGLFRLVSGQGARLDEHDALAQDDFLALGALDGQNRDSRIYLAAPLSLAALEQLFADEIAWRDAVRWDGRSQSVLARRQRRLGALVLSDKPLPAPDPAQITAALLQGLRETGLQKLNWRQESRQLCQRVICLRALAGGEDRLPDFSDSALLDGLEDWLTPFVGKATRLEALTRLDLLDPLLAQLSWAQQQQLAQLAPTHLTVPSGSRIRLDYSDPQAPALPVKLQELFGLAQTPTIAAGRLPVTLHLLSPAGRPVQVTRDLENFWKVGYLEVKKDLKGRYPRHPWPDDPWSASPTRRAKPRA